MSKNREEPTRISPYMHECISICLIARKIVDDDDDVCVAQTITAKLAEAKTHVHMQIEMQIRMNELTDTNVTTAV